MDATNWIFIALAVLIAVGVTLAPFMLGPRFFSRKTRARIRDAMNENMFAPPPGDPLTGAPFPADEDPERDAEE